MPRDENGPVDANGFVAPEPEPGMRCGTPELVGADTAPESTSCSASAGSSTEPEASASSGELRSETSTSRSVPVGPSSPSDDAPSGSRNPSSLSLAENSSMASGVSAVS
jgi:hypothetical protein